MKPQDIVFFIIFAFLWWRQNPKIAVGMALVSLLVSIPLFATWTFFTAERLTWYAAAFFLLAIVLFLWGVKREE